MVSLEVVWIEVEASWVVCLVDVCIIVVVGSPVRSLLLVEVH